MELAVKKGEILKFFKIYQKQVRQSGISQDSYEKIRDGKFVREAVISKLSDVTGWDPTIKDIEKVKINTESKNIFFDDSSKSNPRPNANNMMFKMTSKKYHQKLAFIPKANILFQTKLPFEDLKIFEKDFHDKEGIKLELWQKVFALLNSKMRQNFLIRTFRSKKSKSGDFLNLSEVIDLLSQTLDQPNEKKVLKFNSLSAALRNKSDEIDFEAELELILDFLEEVGISLKYRHTRLFTRTEKSISNLTIPYKSSLDELDLNFLEPANVYEDYAKKWIDYLPNKTFQHYSVDHYLLIALVENDIEHTFTFEEDARHNVYTASETMLLDNYEPWNKYNLKQVIIGPKPIFSSSLLKKLFPREHVKVFDDTWGIKIDYIEAAIDNLSDEIIQEELDNVLKEMTDMKAFYDNSQNLFNQHLDENLIVPIHKQYAEDLTSNFFDSCLYYFQSMYRVNKTQFKGFLLEKFKEYTSRGYAI